MEITKENFEEELKHIADNLKRSRFVGFDAEFTAILSGECFKHRLFDTNRERYDQLKTEVSKMTMTQVGLTMFCYDRDRNTFIATGYTFHLRPQAFGDVDQSFIFQASTLNFLCKHKFDFNKFIYKGLPYLSKAEESKIRNHLKEQTMLEILTQRLEMDGERLLQHHCSEVSKWLSQSSEETLYIDVDSAVMRYILHNEIRMRFPDVLTTDSLGNSRKILIYRNKSIEGATSAPSSQLEEELMNSLLGFSRVIALLEEYKKPIVGHNIFLDLILLHSQFIGPLPKRYETFKKNINTVFPEFYDTKLISHEMSKMLTFDEVWKSNALQDLYEFFYEGKFKKTSFDHIMLSTPFNVNQTYHEAGWDSYCAGYVFCRLGGWAAAGRRGAGGATAGAGGATGPAQRLAALSLYANKANVIRAAVPYMNLVGEDPPSHRPDILHVQAVKDRVINIGKVAALLSSCGSIDVKPYNNRSALIAAGSRYTVDKILKQFRDSNEYRISKYSVYRHSTIGRVTLLSSAFITGSIVLYFLHKKMNS